jgi:4-diphosphocytidyl-2-C-methyl-D-erythritol kinase
MKAVAHAKLNLFLRILGRRDNGLHTISSAMCSLEYGDIVDVSLRDDGINTLDVKGGDAGPELQNLALKAAKVFQDAAALGLGGFDISLEKRIPAGTGLGGGSADAAAVLHLASRLTGAELDSETLAEMGRVVGSDVSFCVVGGLAKVGSTGEEVESLAVPPELQDARFLVAIPDFWLSTGDVYAAFDSLGKTGEEAEPPSVLRGVVEVFVNDLEPAAEWLAPPLKKLRRRLSAIVGAPARMTGSGSAIFAVCGSEEEADEASKAASKFFQKVFVCRPAMHGVTIVD